MHPAAAQNRVHLVDVGLQMPDQQRRQEPSRRKRNGQFKDVAHPLNHETRAWLEDCILSEYDRVRVSSPRTNEELSATNLVSPEPSPTTGANGSGIHHEPAPPMAASSSRAESEGGGRRLDEVQRRHSSDTFWSVG